MGGAPILTMEELQATRRHLWLATALALLLLIGWDLSGLDLAVSRLFGDASGFAWRERWLTRDVLHGGGRKLAAIVIVALIGRAIWPGTQGPTRRERLYWLGVLIVALLAVPTIKRLTVTSCPWDLSEFGGMASYVSHWRLGVRDGGPGHCFPSGHAVAAFALLAQFFLWWPHRRGRALGWLAAVCLAGIALGGAQLARGAHYVSHTLWSAWICWAVALIATAWAPYWSDRPKAVGARAG